MRVYDKQPTEEPEKSLDEKLIQSIIREILSQELPSCEVNKWFIETVHFANMTDKITREICNE